MPTSRINHKIKCMPESFCKDVLGDDKIIKELKDEQCRSIWRDNLFIISCLCVHFNNKFGNGIIYIATNNILHRNSRIQKKTAQYGIAYIHKENFSYVNENILKISPEVLKMIGSYDSIKEQVILVGDDNGFSFMKFSIFKENKFINQMLADYVIENKKNEFNKLDAFLMDELTMDMQFTTLPILEKELGEGMQLMSFPNLEINK
jgi:hypothetical protein